MKIMSAATKLSPLEKEPKSRSAVSESVQSAYSQAVALYDACIRHARVGTATPAPPESASRPIAPSAPSASSEPQSQVDGADDDIPCDFLSYLEWRLGSSRDATTEMLSEWIAAYERQRRSGKGRATGT
jgi:hypothetical protein